ncbi:hypothetical protein D3C87_1142640 [compost metagenome]
MRTVFAAVLHEAPAIVLNSSSQAHSNSEASVSYRGFFFVQFGERKVKPMRRTKRFGFISKQACSNAPAHSLCRATNRMQAHIPQAMAYSAIRLSLWHPKYQSHITPSRTKGPPGHTPAGFFHATFRPLPLSKLKRGTNRAESLTTYTLTTFSRSRRVARH